MLALRKGRVKGATLPPLSPPPTRTVQQPLPGGTWWTSLGVVKVWSKADKKSDLVVELKKGRVYNVLKTDGDWQQIQNYWDDVHEGWVENGKSKCEAAGDPAAAASKFMEQQEEEIASMVTENGKGAKGAAAATAMRAKSGGGAAAASEALPLLKGGRTICRRKIKVTTRIRGGYEIDMTRQKVLQLVRDRNLSKKAEDVRRENNGYHDYYLRSRGTERSVQVDHTLECQLLAFSIVNTESCHDVLNNIDVTEKTPRTGQPQVVQNLINPVFEIHNDFRNLKRLDTQLNIKKGQAVKQWVKDAYKSEYDESFGRILERAFEKGGEVTRWLEEPLHDLEKPLTLSGLVANLEHELAELENPYVEALQNAPSTKTKLAGSDLRRAEGRFQSLAEHVQATLEALDINKAR